MKVRRLVCVGINAVLGACTPGSPGAPDLQRRCDQGASAWFQALHPGGVTTETVDSAIHTEQYTFSDHYNPKLKRCFVIASEEKSTVYPDRPSAGTSARSLLDLDAKVQLGEIVDPRPPMPGQLPKCGVASKRCASMREWEELAAPYMER